MGFVKVVFEVRVDEVVGTSVNVDELAESAAFAGT